MYKVFFDRTAEKIFLGWKFDLSLLFPNVDKLLIQQSFPTARKIAIYVKSLDYTKSSLQSDSDPATMEVVTRTNAVKSPTNSPETTKLVYTVKEVAQMLAISQRAAYNLCNSTTEFRVLRAGGSIRIPKDSFDLWLHRAA